MTALTVNHDKYGIESVKAQQIKAHFQPMLDKMEVLEKEANKVFTRFKKDPTNMELILEAYEIRQKLVKVRTGTKEIHQKQKAFYRQAGLYIDGWKNVQLFAGQDLESQLLGIEKAEERRQEKILYERKEERMNQLREYEVEGIESMGLATMPENVFVILLEGCKDSFNKAKIAKDEAEKQELLDIEKRRLLRNRTLDMAEYKYIYNQETKGYKELTIDTTEEEFKKMFAAADGIRVQARKDKEKLIAKNQKLNEERERKQRVIDKKKARTEKRDGEMQPLMVYIRDYTGMLDMTEKDYQKELGEIKQAKIDNEVFLAEQLIKENRKKKLEEERKRKEQEQEKQKLEAAKAPDKEKLVTFANEIADMKGPDIKDAELKKVLDKAVLYLQNTSKFITDKLV